MHLKKLLKRKKLLLVIVLLIAIIAIAFLFPDLFRQYKYKSSYRGIDFYSDSKPPAELLKEIASQKTFVVSPQFYSGSSTANSYMNNSLVTFIGVLIAKNKTAISLVRSYSGTNLVGCLTNDGNVHVNRELTTIECEAMLTNETDVKILVNFPDAKLQNSEIIVSENRIVLKPKGYEDIDNLGFSTLSLMFEDTEQILAKINQRIEAVQGR